MQVSNSQHQYELAKEREEARADAMKDFISDYTAKALIRLCRNPEIIKKAIEDAPNFHKEAINDAMVTLALNGNAELLQAALDRLIDHKLQDMAIEALNEKESRYEQT